MNPFLQRTRWEEFLDHWLTREGEWLFRGDAITNRDDPFRSLRTSFDRALENWGDAINEPDRWKIEKELIRDFQRRFDHSNASRPSNDHTLTWLALMQHHGAPTRLLDWTYSPFVGAFFAFSGLLDSKPSETCSVVWAIKRAWFDEQLKTQLCMRDFNHIERIKLNDPESFESLFRKRRTNKRFVYPVMPYELNQRLIIQQGVFLCPTDITMTFSENFRAMFQEFEDTDCLKIFEFSRADLEDALIDLYRMNIYDASLFPGIDGYAKSFKTRLPIIHRIIKDQGRC